MKEVLKDFSENKEDSIHCTAYVLLEDFGSSVVLLDDLKDHGLAVASVDGILRRNYFLVQTGFSEYQWVGLSRLIGEGDREVYINRRDEKVGSFRDMVARALDEGWAVCLLEDRAEFVKWIKNVGLNQ